MTEDDKKFAAFGRKAFEYLKECVTDKTDLDRFDLADAAVHAGLVAHVRYDPAKHRGPFINCAPDPGDMIYYWGNESADKED